MKCARVVLSAFAVLLCLSFYASAAEKKSKDTKTDEASKPSYELAQPATENLDYTMYQRIRDEGLAHSHVHGVRVGADGWDWTAADRLSEPEARQRVDARPVHSDGLRKRSPRRLGRVWHGMAAAEHVDSHVGAGHGGVHCAGAALVAVEPRADQRAGGLGEAKDEKDLEKYKGKLAGKIVFFGEMRDVKPVDKPLWERWDEANLEADAEYPVHVGEQEDFFADFHQASGIPREGGRVLRHRARARGSWCPAATAVTTAVPAERSLTTAAADGLVQPTSANTPIRFRSW